MISGAPRIEALGEGALLVTFGDRIDPDANRLAHGLAAAIESARAAEPRLGRSVPAYASVLVPFDAVAIEPAEVRATIARLVAVTPSSLPLAGPGRMIELDVRYGGPDGPDLDEVAALHGLRPADVIELHAAAEYGVYCLGFAPGFAYLGPLPAAIAAPRRAAPRERVPAGSVGIAGEQTGVYPFDLPGGWQIIGRTDARLWDAERDSPALLGPGARVRFRPIR